MASTAPSASPSSTGDQPKPNIGEILKKSGMRALGGGMAGAAAMGINVGALMWLRTTVNYQYRKVYLYLYSTYIYRAPPS